MSVDLPAPVLAEQRMDAAGADLDGDTVEDGVLEEALGEAPGREQRCRHRLPLLAAACLLQAEDLVEEGEIVGRVDVAVGREV
ncbi:MAG: hypothetical protein KDG49_21055, partial [Geminicoccaceae bacterium]|nr:hypothetical protein [Geminicoccaceae bacterium]